MEDIKLIHSHNREKYEYSCSKQIKLGKFLIQRRKELRNYHNISYQDSTDSYGKVEYNNGDDETNDLSFKENLEKNLKKLENSSRVVKTHPKKFNLKFAAFEAVDNSASFKNQK